MAAGAYKTVYGSVAGGLIYATKFLLGSLDFSKNQNPQDPVSIEGKFNNHIEKAFKKIEEWKRKHVIGCEIFLAFGTNFNETIEFSLETVIGGEDKGIFLKNLKTENISIFEKLADDLTKEKISVINEYGENLQYNYSKKLQDFCKGKEKIVLTYQSLSWNYNKTPQNHSFWLPKEQSGKSNRILVFDYQEREYEEDLKKIKKWQNDNGNCEITLFVDDTETIKVNDIETNPYNFFGSSLFVKDITSSGGSKISRFEKLASDLESKKISLTNEYGESLPYDYSKKLKDSCSNNKITLTFQSLNWTPKGKSKEQHSFWLPQEQKDSGNRTLVFNYQERDYTTPLNKIKKWKKENDSESCEIILFVTDTESIKISEIESNPYNFLGSELFVKNITKDGKSISKFEKLANDLAQGRFEVIDTAGENLDYSYSKKIKNSCDKNSNSITLKLTTVTWDPNNKPKQEYTFWLPKDENDNKILVFNFLERDYKSPLEKINEWKKNNDNCEITLSVSNNESIKISDFENNPTDYLGSSLFTRDLDDVGMGTKISKFEKLANDLEKGKIKLINQYGEDLDFSYSKKIKDACKNNQVTLTFKEVKWTDRVSKKEQKHSFWIPESEKDADNKTIIFNHQERDYESSLEKIKKWKDDNNCEITLVLDSTLLGGEKIKISEILENTEKKLWSPVFVEHLDAEQRDNKSSGTKISSFERLANDLSTGKITITNDFAETLKYDYSEKIKYSCNKKSNSITLTYQKVSWSAGGKQHTYNFWLPQGETKNRTLVFDFQVRDYQDSLTKIKKWQKDNGNCEIKLFLSNSETISIEKFTEDPHKFLGSQLFAQTLDPDERDGEKKGTKISRFDRLAKDLETGTMKVSDKFGESLDFEYSQKLKDLCNKDKNSKKSITLSLSTVSWRDDVNKKNYKLTLWLPQSETDKENAVFTYLKRDYETATKKVKEWGEMDGEEKCEIKLTINSSKNWYATMSDILDNPRGYVGAGLFTKELTRTVIKNGVQVTERYSKMEKIAEELFSKTIKITDEHGEEYNYDYSKKIRDICKESTNKTATLAYLKSEWTDQVNNQKYELSYWHPKDKTTIDLIFNYLDRDYKTPIQKIKNWEKENDCEIEIVLRQDNNETVTTSQILENPNKYLGVGIFDKKIFIKDKDETQDRYEKGVTTKYSQMEKLAKDLEEKKIKILNDKQEDAHFYYSEGLRTACKDSNKKVKVYWRKIRSYQYWTWEEKKNTDSWFTNNVKSLKKEAEEEAKLAKEKEEEEKRKAAEKAERKATSIKKFLTADFYETLI